ncbi:MAG: hypothetical protein Q4A28_10275 [Brachymonas sp.]|nr:hypothetical protein [Brachymonas sp.]
MLAFTGCKLTNGNKKLGLIQCQSSACLHDALIDFAAEDWFNVLKLQTASSSLSNGSCLPADDSTPARPHGHFRPAQQ